MPLRVGCSAMVFSALNFSMFCPWTSSISVVGEQRVGSRGGRVRESVLWAADGSSCQLISLDCMQAAYRGTYPSPGVCETPAWCGCLPELVHQGGHQRKEVRALGPGEVPEKSLDKLPFLIMWLLHPSWWEEQGDRVSELRVSLWWSLQQERRPRMVFRAWEAGCRE